MNVNALLSGMFTAGVLVAAAEPVKVSERFGFDPEDSTKCIQRALDSGLPEIVLDRQKTPWVTKPLHGRSNQTLYFENGTELVAKAGEFPGKVDALIRYENVTNVAVVGLGARGGVCRMRKADYHRAPYVKSEWRHGIFFVNAVRFRVENMTVVESGGDGVDILGAGCRDGVLRKVTCDRNNRQGLSVEGCTGLLIEDCTFSNTKGTPPEAGVDFETFRTAQPMAGIVMRRCRVEGNGGNGIELFTGSSDGTTPPYDITVEDCTVVGNMSSIRVGTGLWRMAGDGKGMPQGRVSFRNCRLENAQRYAIAIDGKPPEAFTLEFDRCAAIGCEGGEEDVDVRLRGSARGAGLVENNLPGNIVFRDFTVRQPRKRAWIRCVTVAEFSTNRVRQVSGSVTVSGPDGKATETVFGK